jgi:hypothetical protein
MLQMFDVTTGVFSGIQGFVGKVKKDNGHHITGHKGSEVE